MNMGRNRWLVVAFVAVPVFSLGMASDGCNAPETTSLEGVWSITRGETDVTITWHANGADGNVSDGSSTGTLTELDPAEFPPEVEPLIDQWNAGLADLNAKLDEAMPDSVVITFPANFQMRITNADDTANTATGLINADDAYFFLTDISGGGAGSDQGGGAVLNAASIEGSFNRAALTTTGAVTRRLVVLLAGSNDDSLSLVVEIDVNYTGTRTGDVPDDFVEPVGNSNDNTDDSNDNGDNANGDNDNADNDNAANP